MYHYEDLLTHWDQDKMDAISQTTFFLIENVWIPIEISLKFVCKGPINNIPALLQIMAWHRPGDKPLSEHINASLGLNELTRGLLSLFQETKELSLIHWNVFPIFQ